MSDRNECSPGDFANFAAVKAQRDAANALLAATQAAVEAAATNGLVNIQMKNGPAPGEKFDAYWGEYLPTADPFYKFVQPGPVVQASIQNAVIAIMRGDATLA